MSNVKKTIGKWVIVGILLAFVVGCKTNDESVLESPDGKIRVSVVVKDGTASYTIHRNDTLVMENSKLGVVLNDQDFSANVRMVSTSDAEKVSDNFSMHQGKRMECSYEANRKVYRLENAQQGKLDVVFQVSNDGVAFHYDLPATSETVRTIIREHSSFNFDLKTTAFLQPMSDPKTGWSKVNPCYEEFYQKEIAVGTPSPTNSGWVYPALFHSGNNWILITEAGLDRNYCGTRLTQKETGGEYFVTFPDSLENFPGGGVNPTATGAMKSPWRIITLGTLKTIVESDLGVALANKAVEMDASFIKPGHSSWSWALLKDDSTVYDVQKKFVDHAAEMQWEYCLVDAEWDKRIGYDKIKELSTYAASKNVGLILWYNSAGSWNETPYTPKDKLLTHESREAEFSKLKALGIKGIKVDFFGGDGQSMIAYYIDILEDAAKYNILVNFHGATIPRGWHRTYPNLMSMEAIRGFEYVTFEQVNADEQPSHCTMLPFTRNAFDPMDFTPLSLDSVPRINRRTSAGFELALPIIFLSGIQHFVETPRGMKNVPVEVKEFLKTLPTQWDDTKFISGYPGKDVVIARKGGNKWFVGGINGEQNPKTFSIDFSDLNIKKAFIIRDSNSQSRVALEKVALSITDGKASVTVNGNGGFVIVEE